MILEGRPERAKEGEEGAAAINCSAKHIHFVCAAQQFESHIFGDIVLNSLKNIRYLSPCVCVCVSELLLGGNVIALHENLIFHTPSYGGI